MKNRSGFTLVELTLALAIFSFMLLVLTSGILQLYRIYAAGVAIRSTQQGARQLTDEITRIGRSAAAIQTGSNTIGPYTQDSICFYNNSPGSSAGVMYYSKQASAPAGFAPTIELHKVVFTSLDSQAGCPTANPGGQDSVVTGSDISILKFATDSEDVATDPNATNGPYISNISFTVAATSALDSSLLQMFTDSDGNQDVRCTGGQGSQYCSMTHLKTSVATRREVSE